MPTDGRRFVLYAFMLGAVVGVFLTAVWVGFWIGLTFDHEGMSPDEVHREIVSSIIGCGLLLAAAVVFALLGVELWLIVIDVVVALFLVLCTALLTIGPARGHDTLEGNPWHEVAGMWAHTPTTWPMLLLLAGGAAVTSWSGLARR
jgi:amino acid transporter